MKNILILFVMVVAFGCSKNDPEPDKEPDLIGTRWSAFNYKSIVDGSNVYQLLYFKSATQVERYSASEKTSIIGNIDTFSYTYKDPVLTIVLQDNKPYQGEVFEKFIRFGGKEFQKEP